MKRQRVCADTSVFGGCFDDEFSDDSREFFAEVRAGRFVLVMSTTTLDELKEAPQRVRDFVSDLPATSVETVTLCSEIEDLRDAYVAAGVVGPSSSDDAEHIASASVADVDLIVSWNFRHIVHFDKIRGYHAVNLVEGYRSIPIHTPREVVKS